VCNDHHGGRPVRTCSPALLDMEKGQKRTRFGEPVRESERDDSRRDSERPATQTGETLRAFVS